MNNVECIHENLERNIDERHNNACYALINNSSQETNIWRVFVSWRADDGFIIFAGGVDLCNVKHNHERLTGMVG